jgi:argininosuccinate synthase
MVRIAKEEGAMFVAHGATGKGNDQVRFEMCAQALDSKIKTIAPWRDAEFIESFKGRSDLLAYCTKHGIPVDAKPKSNYSIDENLFHTSYESGVLEDADATYEESMFKMSVSPQAAPETSTNIEIEFVEGIPVKLTNTTTGDVKVSIVRFFLVDHIITVVSPLPLCSLIISPFPSLPSIPMSLSPIH